MLAKRRQYLFSVVLADIFANLIGQVVGSETGKLTPQHPLISDLGGILQLDRCLKKQPRPGLYSAYRCRQIGNCHAEEKLTANKDYYKNDLEAQNTMAIITGNII